MFKICNFSFSHNVFTQFQRCWFIFLWCIFIIPNISNHFQQKYSLWFFWHFVWQYCNPFSHTTNLLCYRRLLKQLGKNSLMSKLSFGRHVFKSPMLQSRQYVSVTWKHLICERASNLLYTRRHIIMEFWPYIQKVITNYGIISL